MSADMFLYFAGFLLLYIFTGHFLHKLQNLPPNPYPSLPIIGHLYLLKTPLHRALARLSYSHGPLLFFRFGSRPVLVVSSPSLAEECLTKNDMVFANRPRFTVGKHLGYNYTTMAWASYSDHWRNLRRISSIEVLSANRLQMLSSIRAEEIKSTIRRLANQQNEAVEMRTVFFELTLNIMMRMIAGKRYFGENGADLKEVKKFQQIVAETTRLSGLPYISDYLPFMRWAERRKEKEMTELHKRRDEFMQSLIEAQRKGLRSGSYSLSEEKKNMIEVLLSLQEREPEYYTDEIIRGLMIVLLVGATEPSVSTMEWAVALLLDHPEILKKAQKEIDDQIGHNRLIDESDIARLPYLNNVVQETLRMYSPLPLGVPHESSEDCTVGGFRVPRGTMLIVNLWGIENDPTLWNDPEKFMPERFQGVEGARDGFRFMPFGSGRRRCPGNGLSMKMIALELGSLIQCFEWDKVCEEKEDMRERTTATISKAKRLQAKCRPRPASENLLSKI
ncbi:hypothetical protein K2173_028435 [Erythroxylum novogranatense]|uniref:Cytochrome P450 n=1 Tax=Erythroxylum novogranatense TaxID=1862640 RepID=A0AAV8U4M5_9ROSI|nr:hypothetical protein K2173_028435 [Erythroxylum novogranatense]